MATPNWSKDFEIMCDASDYAMGVVLKQRTEKIFRAIYYANKTFNEAQESYSTTKNEMLVMVCACEKFRPYILGSHVIIHTDHAAIKYLMAKCYCCKNLTWRLKTKKGSDNVIVDYLSRIEKPSEEEEKIEIEEKFPNEQLFQITVQVP